MSPRPRPHPETRGTLACALRINGHFGGMYWVVGGIYFSMQAICFIVFNPKPPEPGPSMVCASGGGEVVTKPLFGNYPISRLENRLISTRPRPAQHPALFTDPATQHGEMTCDDMPSVSSMCICQLSTARVPLDIQPRAEPPCPL